MERLDIEELDMTLERFVRRVLEAGRPVVLVEHGRTVAHVLPVEHVSRSDAEEDSPAPPERAESSDVRVPEKRELVARLAKIDRLAAEIGSTWPAGVSAVDAVRDVRRDL